MLRSALALLSTFQIGMRVRESVERSLKLAGLVAVAALFLIAAASFGLIAAYHTLVLSHGYTPPEAAGIIAKLSVSPMPVRSARNKSNRRRFSLWSGQAGYPNAGRMPR